jgi:serine/threonine protein phosphatase PrpC
MTLSSPHKPENPEERRRIEEAGGMVLQVQGIPRLNGVLNLSRSLGDIGAKPMISSKPDMLMYKISEFDTMLFLSTDGVWDSLTNDEIFDAVRLFIAEHSYKDYYMLADFIANKAKEANSADNMTLICIYLAPVKEIWNMLAKNVENKS